MSRAKANPNTKRINNSKYDRGAHSVYTLRYHIIWCVKYRRKVLTTQIGDRLKAILQDFLIASNCHCEAIETDIDHVHMLIRTRPTCQLSKLLQILKGVSSRLLMIEYPELKQQMRRGHIWSPSYFVATVGDVNKETIQGYIEMQRSRSGQAR